MRVTLKLVVVASSPCTDTCFESLVMRILFNGILQILLKQHFAYHSCFCQKLSSGSMSGLNRMFLSSTVSWCLLAKRRNPFLFVAAISLANLFLQNLPPSRVPWPHSVETLTLLVPKTLQRNLWQRLELVSGRSPLWLTADDAKADSLHPSSCKPFAHNSFLFFCFVSSPRLNYETNAESQRRFLCLSKKTRVSIPVGVWWMRDHAQRIRCCISIVSWSVNEIICPRYLAFSFKKKEILRPGSRQCRLLSECLTLGW